MCGWTLLCRRYSAADIWAVYKAQWCQRFKATQTQEGRSVCMVVHRVSSHFGLHICGFFFSIMNFRFGFDAVHYLSGPQSLWVSTSWFFFHMAISQRKIVRQEVFSYTQMNKHIPIECSKSMQTESFVQHLASQWLRAWDSHWLWWTAACTISVSPVTCFWSIVVIE